MANGGVSAMGQAVPVRTDYTAGEVRRFAKRAKDAAQARRLLAIAAVLDGVSRGRTASSNPSTKSSTTAATPGTRSSISPGKSCPSLAAIGQSPVTHCEGWYYMIFVYWIFGGKLRAGEG